MIQAYLQAALRKATYKKLDDGTWFAEISGCNGVWANAGSVEDSRQELAEVLEEWILLNIKTNTELPVLDGIALRIGEPAAVGDE